MGTQQAAAGVATGPRRSALGWPGATRIAALAVVPVYVAGSAAYLVLEQRLGMLGKNPFQTGVIVTGFACFAVLGALVAARRPGNAVGWLMAVAALLIGLAPAGDAYAAWVMTTRGRPDGLAVVGAWVQSWYWLPLLALVSAGLPLFFPDGRLPSRRWLLPTLLVAGGLLTAVVLGMLTDTLTGQDVPYRIANPIGVHGLAPVEQLPVFGVLGVFLGVGVLEGIAAVVVRFRRSRGTERQQMKWFLYAVAPLLLTPAQGFLPDIVGSLVFGWMLIALPVAVAVAVLRYQLDGIDVVINRTLVYGALTAVVVAVYVFVVGYLGATVAAGHDLPVSLIATGLVAVLFAPLRERLQRGVDRLMYGQRAEPYAALSRLGTRLEGTLAPDAVLDTIVGTVREALRLPYAAVSVVDDGEPGRVASESGAPVPGTVRLPMLYRNETVGELVLGLRPGESGFSPADLRLLSDLARQAGVAVSAVRLTADLQRSRERLVSTREEERRRLRRDLHDGLGAQLAGLAVQAGVLRGLIARDPEAAETLTGELRTELKAAITDIRRLVYELRPPALDELGLGGALQRLAERIGADVEGPRVTVDAAGLPSLPAAAEVAVYRIAQEALTNVVRHAAARSCLVRVTVDPVAVMLEVVDDGAGFQGSCTAGVGLASMRERAAEMGGECLVEPGARCGIRVMARLPRSEGA